MEELVIGSILLSILATMLLIVIKNPPSFYWKILIMTGLLSLVYIVMYALPLYLRQGSAPSFIIKLCISHVLVSIVAAFILYIRSKENEFAYLFSSCLVQVHTILASLTLFMIQ